MIYLSIQNAPAPPTPQEEFVHHALKLGALELLPELRKLKSGRMSPYFYNSGNYNTGAAMDLLGDSYAKAARSHFDFDVVFGPAYKGIPLAVATAMRICWATGYETTGYAFDRKEAKDHGEGGIIVGSSVEGKRVIIVDDVITNGKTKAEAVKTVKDHGGEVVGLVIAFDRQERGQDTQLSAVQEFEQNNQIPVVAIATFTHLIDFVDRVRYHLPALELAGILGQLNEYQRQYGAT